VIGVVHTYHLRSIAERVAEACQIIFQDFQDLQFKMTYKNSADMTCGKLIAVKTQSSQVGLCLS
jgi:hypothetical protein